MKRLIVITLTAATLAGCGSDADVASDNLGKAAEQFEIQRKIVGINGITDEVLFEVEGRCSLEKSEALAGDLEVVCKHGPKDFRKHFVGLRGVRVMHLPEPAPEIIMDATGVYWRRYPHGDASPWSGHLSMVPVSDGNDPVLTPIAVYRLVGWEDHEGVVHEARSDAETS